MTELSRGPCYRACYHGYTTYVWSTYGLGRGRGATGAGVGEAGNTGPLHGAAENWRVKRPMSDGAHLLSLQLSSSLGIVYGSISTVRMRKEVGGMLLLHTTGGKAVILLILR